jgi:small subunit ribosomal protein S16
MSVTVRLSRVGSTHGPRYRIVVQPTKSKRDGKAIDVLGYFHPLREVKDQVSIDLKKLDTWVSQGAIVSRTVSSIAKKARNN